MARQSEDETSDLRHVRQVDRAAADLRRGMPVIGRGAVQSGIIVSAETATAAEYGELLGLAEGDTRTRLEAEIAALAPRVEQLVDRRRNI